MAWLVGLREDHPQAAQNKRLFRGGEVIEALDVHPGGKLLREDGTVADPRFFVIEVPGVAADYAELTRKDIETTLIPLKGGGTRLAQKASGRRVGLNLAGMNAAHRADIAAGRVPSLPSRAAVTALTRARGNGRN